MRSLPVIRDARYFQIVFQGIFLLYGIFVLHWNGDLTCFLLYFTASMLTQLSWEVVKNKFSFKALPFVEYGSWKSAAITAFGLCLLLKTSHWHIAVLAAFISISGKYIFTWNRKHIFNPSALGIVATILLTQQAWISPGQWGSSVVLFFMVCSLGFVVVTRVQKVDVSLAYLSTYVLLLFSRQILFQGWPVDYYIQSVTTGSLLLFSFFMISDPKTTPNHPVARVLYACIVAGVAFYLSAFRFINGAPVWVLVFTSPLVPVLDWLFVSEKFQWLSFKNNLPPQKIIAS